MDQNLNAMSSRIAQCDMNRDYIFISYSRKDWEVVWRDVLRFQAEGWNIWIDKENLDGRNHSWEDDALRAIQNDHCKLLVFYVSASSLCSAPCLEELQETVSETTETLHGLNTVKFIAVDAEDVGNLEHFYRAVFEQQQALRDSADIEKKINNDQFNDRVIVLSTIFKDFFGGSNEKPRTSPMGNDPDGYYRQIMRHFPPTCNNQEGAESPVLPPAAKAVPSQADPVDPDMALLLRRAEEYKDIEAQCELSNHYYKQGDLRTACQWAERCYEQTRYQYQPEQAALNQQLLARMGVCHWKLAQSEGREEDWLAAEELAGRHCEQCDKRRRSLCSAYFSRYVEPKLKNYACETETERGIGTIRCDCAKHFCEWFDRLYRSAKEGDPQAQYELAQSYESHWELAKRFCCELTLTSGSVWLQRSRAKKWYQRSAEQGYQPAVEALG